MPSILSAVSVIFISVSTIACTYTEYRMAAELFANEGQEESVVENAVTQALTKENSETNVLDDVNLKIEKTSQLANDAMTRFHQKHPEFYAVQECPSCGRMCLYDAVFGVLDDPTRIKYKCKACNREFERETGYWISYYENA